MPLLTDRSGWPGQLLAEGIALFARQPGVVLPSHHWPTWGTGETITYLMGDRFYIMPMLSGFNEVPSGSTGRRTRCSTAPTRCRR